MKKLFVMLSMVLMTAGMLAGCRKKPNSGTEPTNPPGSSVTLTPFQTAAPIQTKELPIYTISADQKELVAVTALLAKEQELNERVVAEAVVDALADSAFYVKVNCVSVQDSRILVDFDGSAPPVVKVSKEVEELILDAFAQSIIDNIASCNEVSFLVDGKAYKSAHLKMDEDYVYLRR